MNAHISLSTLPLDWDTGVFTTIGGPGDVDEAPPAPVQHIGKYEILDRLGNGAMGVVHRALDPVLEREVALKVMLPRIADDAEHKRRFEREARAVARMSHPNVVTVFDLGYHTDGSPYIVMELLKGRDLLQALRATPAPSLEEKLQVILQVLEGLGHAHRAGIVHRDIKPANIFITEAGVAKIMDFGVAHLPAGSGGTGGVVVGTANYMSPEQILGTRIDGRSDLFSVGSMLAEMLTGRAPFQAETAMATMYRVAHKEPSLRLPDGGSYEAVRPILLRALAKAPEERFPTAEELAAAVRSCLRGKEVARTEKASAAPGKTEAAPRLPARTTAPSRPPDPAGICKALREVHLGRKSGQLHFSHADEHRSLRIRQGRIVHGTSDVGGEHLGDVLVRYGHLSQPDLERAVAVVLRDRKRLGEVLTEMRLIGREALDAAVSEHAREILFSALERFDASYAFEEMPDDPRMADLTCELSTGEVILEATRRVHDPALIERALGDLSRILVSARDPRLRDQKVTLTPTDGFVLSRIDGTLSAREMLSLVPGSPEDASRSLFGLLCTGLLDYRLQTPRPPAPSGPPRPRPEGSSPRPMPRVESATPIPRPSMTASGPAAPAGPLVGDALRQMILSAYESLRYKDHFEFLDVPRAASDAEIKDAYSRLVRLLHPDVCRDPAVADLVTERSAVFARLCQAYETLRNPGTRATYERDVAPVKRRPSLPRTASPQEEAAATAPSSRTVVGATLPPEQSQAVVLTSLLDDPPPTDGRSQAAAAFMAATQLVKQEKYWDAIQLLEPAIPRLEGAARNRARVLLAQAYLKNPHWSKRAEAVLQGVVADDPACVEAYFLLAGLYLKAQLEARATAMFRKVLKLQPDHTGAAAGLKAVEAAKERAGFHLPFLARA